MIENPPQSSVFDSEIMQGLDGADSQHPDAVTAGQLLREAREGVGLHLEALAVALKVPVKKLEALETGRHDLLLDMVFVRALACSVCRILKIDPAPVLALLPYAGPSNLNVVSAWHQASFSAYQPAPKPASRSSVSAPAAVGGLLLVIGAAVLVFLPSIRETFVFSSLAGRVKETVVQAFDKLGLSSSSADATADVGVEAPVPGISEVAGPKALTTLSIVAPPRSDVVVLTPSARLASTREDPSAVTTRLASTASPVVSSAAATGLQTALDTAVGNQIVTFSATAQPSWVKVTDAKGAVVLSRTISPGEQVAASGALPLFVVVGRANATRVMVRGVALDLGAFSKENIARFEVK